MTDDQVNKLLFALDKLSTHAYDDDPALWQRKRRDAVRHWAQYVAAMPSDDTSWLSEALNSGNGTYKP